jgi:hypothetical protein
MWLDDAVKYVTSCIRHSWCMVLGVLNVLESGFELESYLPAWHQWKV